MAELEKRDDHEQNNFEVEGMKQLVSIYAVAYHEFGQYGAALQKLLPMIQLIERAPSN